MEQSNIYVCVYIYIDIHTYIYKATRGKEARKGEMEGELKVLIKDAEMDVKLVLEDMWNSAHEIIKDDYIREYHALCDKYMEPRVGQRVRLCALLIRHVRQKGPKKFPKNTNKWDNV